MNKQEIENRISELKELSIKTNEELSMLEQQLKDYDAICWKPNMGEYYFFVYSNGKISEYKWTEDETDIFFLSIGNVYKTKEEAEEKGLRKMFEQQLFTKLRAFANKNNDKEIDWNDANQEKYYINYDYRNKKLETYFVTYNRVFQNDVFFTSLQIAERAMKIFKDDLMKYYKTK